jgi:hypothetical protein
LLWCRRSTSPRTYAAHPTVADLADHLACSPAEIREALRDEEAAWPLSLDAPVRAADTTIAAIPGCRDRAYTHVELPAHRPVAVHAPVLA